MSKPAVLVVVVAALVGPGWAGCGGEDESDQADTTVESVDAPEKKGGDDAAADGSEATPPQHGGGEQARDQGDRSREAKGPSDSRRRLIEQIVDAAGSEDRERIERLREQLRALRPQSVTPSEKDRKERGEEMEREAEREAREEERQDRSGRGAPSGSR
jgi:hypothetical protein